MKIIIIDKSLIIRNLVNIAFFTILAFSTIANAQNYPPQELLSSVNYQSYQAPSETLPGYLEPFTEPMSGSTITRVSDKNVFGTSGQRLRHNYSKDQTWNSDGTLIKLAGYPAAILDAETYEFLYWRSIPSYGRWANTEANYMYGTPGNTFVKFNVQTDSRVVLRTFSEYSEISFGYGEGNQSNDDRYVGLIGKSGGSQTLIVYDIQNDQIVGTKNVGSSGALDWFSVSQLGNYAVISWAPNGSGSNEGLKVYNMDMTNERHISDHTGHGDLGIDANGNEVMVAYAGEESWDQGSYLFSVRLDGGGKTNLFVYPGGIWGGHISCRNIDRPGWAYISEQCCTSNEVAAREIFAVKLDGSGIIERYTKHHNNVSPGNGHSTMAVPNRDGTKILFASNWDNNNVMSDPNPPVWILEYPQTALSIEDEAVVDSNTFKVYPNPTTDIVNIKVKEQVEVSKLQLHDMLGRTILDKTVDSNDTDMSLNLSSYPRGVYLLSVVQDGTPYTKKIILN